MAVVFLNIVFSAINSEVLTVAILQQAHTNFPFVKSLAVKKFPVFHKHLKQIKQTSETLRFAKPLLCPFSI